MEKLPEVKNSDKYQYNYPNGYPSNYIFNKTFETQEEFVECYKFAARAYISSKMQSNVRMRDYEINYTVLSIDQMKSELKILIDLITELENI